MSVKKEPSGRRSVQVEVQVPGTPEQVWEAIATGPGISSWFVPTRMEGRAGGTLSCDFGGGMVSSASIKEWQPPRRFLAEDSTWIPGGPPVATEWTVEASGGGMCVVRVVHSLFASTDDWDNQLEGTETGWPTFFRVLRLYLAQHRGQRSATMQAMATGSGSTDQIWATLTRGLGIASPKPGQAVRIQAQGAGNLAGTVEHVDQMKHGRSMFLRLTAPQPGVFLAGAHDCNGMLLATLQAFFYGDGADAAARDQSRWQAWLGQLFPAPSAAASP
jgi:uncharacterized protein YndB with AHSA1/START domain